MTRVVSTITPESFSDVKHFVGRCTAEGCREPVHATWDTQRGAEAWMRGWFRQHIAQTGHTVVVEELV